MAKVFLADTNLGDRVETFVIIRKLELREYNGKHYALFQLGDRSGRMAGILWNNALEIARSFKNGTVVKIMGTVAEYKDSRQIKLDGIRAAQEDEYIASELYSGPQQDLGILEDKMDAFIESVQVPYLKTLLENLIGKNGKHRELFLKAPGGKLWHHNYRGGLLEHTVSVTGICSYTAGEYSRVNRDLLITGALLHDLGKVTEYEYETPVIDFSTEGRLLGHIVIGNRMISEEIKQIPDFPAETKNCLSHMILAHQGQKDYGSPVVPQTIEALLVYYADEMDSKAVAFTRILNETERAGKEWSSFVQLMERYLYAGPRKEE